LAGVVRAGGITPLEYQKYWSKTLNPSTTELALDWIISPDVAGTSWTGITSPGRPVTYDTSVLTRGTPAAVNVLAFDGHVESRQFNQPNATPIQQGGGPTAPYFWIPNP